MFKSKKVPPSCSPRFSASFPLQIAMFTLFSSNCPPVFPEFVAMLGSTSRGTWHERRARTCYRQVAWGGSWRQNLQNLRGRSMGHVGLTWEITWFSHQLKWTYSGISWDYSIAKLVGPLFTIAKFVNITPITMVYGTYNYSYEGL